MKKLMIVAAVAAGTIAWADNKTPASQLSDEERELYRTGGTVYEPGSKKGEIVYVNCQTAAKNAWLQESIDFFAEQTELDIKLKQGGVFNVSNPALVGSLTLFIIDDPALPTLLYAPDARWSMMNVATLKSDKGGFFEARVKKQLTRAFAYLCGAGDSRYPRSLMAIADGVNGIDHFPDYRLPVDVVGRFRRYVSKFGVTPPRFTAYANACREGWAANPTNKYQKAIWDKVHELPKNPIKIKPETKPVKE